eukprot:m.136166 g.136166  ORF g.136166 m.136166 type:complete len:353 (-) comp11428_c3_seq3:169-1227(-)
MFPTMTLCHSYMHPLPLPLCQSKAGSMMATGNECVVGLVLLCGLLAGDVHAQTTCNLLDKSSGTAECGAQRYDLSQASSGGGHSYLSYTDPSSSYTYYFQGVHGGLPSSACSGISSGTAVGKAGAAYVVATGSLLLFSFFFFFDFPDMVLFCRVHFVVVASLFCHSYLSCCTYHLVLCRIIAFYSGCTTAGLINGQNWQLISVLGGESDVQVTYTGGSGGMSAVVTFTCAQNQSQSVMTLTDDSNNIIKLGITTMYACAGVLPRPAKHSATSTGQTQIGWILVGLSLGLFSAYLVGGIVYNHRQGVEGLERIPHRSFWRSLPGLVADGVSFTQAKVTGKNPSAKTYHRYDEL